MWIVPPATSSDKFTFNIKLVKPLEAECPHVRQTVLTERVLRKLLMKNLPPQHSSPISIDMFINCTRSGSLDMRSLGNISLSDEAACNLGWITDLDPEVSKIYFDAKDVLVNTKDSNDERLSAAARIVRAFWKRVTSTIN
jgi:hypothetical protein